MSKARPPAGSRAQRFLLHLAASVGAESRAEDADVLDTLARALDTAARDDVLRAIDRAIDQVAPRSDEVRAAKPVAGHPLQGGREQGDPAATPPCDPFFFG